MLLRKSLGKPLGKLLGKLLGKPLGKQVHVSLYIAMYIYFDIIGEGQPCLLLEAILPHELSVAASIRSRCL